MRRTFLILFAFSIPQVASAQIWNLNGGSSTLARSSGGNVTVYFPGSTTRLGFGISDNRFLASAESEFKWRDLQLDIGDQNLRFGLPTDFADGQSYGFLARGLSVKRINQKGSLAIFVGQTARNYSAPYFRALRGADPAALLFYDRQLNPHWKFSNRAILSSKQTIIESLDYSPIRDIHLSASGGMGSNSPFAAVRFNLLRSWIKAVSSYTITGQRFRRITVSNAWISESTGLNAQVDLKWHKTFFTAGHQNLLSINSSGRDTAAAVDSIGANVEAGILDLHGAIFAGRSSLGHSNGQVVGVGVRFWDSAITFRSDYFHSAFGATISSSAAEKVGQHFRLMQFVTWSGGRTTVSFGGEYHSNLWSASVGYQTLYFPLFAGQNPFQQSLVAQVSFHLPHSSSVSIATNIGVDGKLRYSVDGGTYFYSDKWMGRGSSSMPGSFGKYVVHILVVTPAGEPVEGVAIRIHKEICFSNSRGEIAARFTKTKPLTLTVLPEEFTAPGAWGVVNSPATVTPAVEPTQIKITVERQL